MGTPGLSFIDRVKLSHLGGGQSGATEPDIWLECLVDDRFCGHVLPGGGPGGPRTY